MEHSDYDDLEIVLEGEAPHWSAHIAVSPVGPTGPVPIFLPASNEMNLRELVRTMNHARGVDRRGAVAQPGIRAYGQALFSSTFHGEVLAAYRSSLRTADTANRGLRVRVRLSDAPQLANLPWEMLYDPERHRFPCQYAKYPTVRQWDSPERSQPLGVAGAVRMLVVLANPTDLPELDIDQEWRCLQAALSPHVDSGHLILNRCEIPTLDALRQTLDETEYHVVHFVGHGDLDESTGEGLIALTDRYGRADYVNAQVLAVLLSNSPVRLVVLNACDGARVSEVDPFASTAITLVDQGVPAVIAMQFEISDKAAIAFSNALYVSLTAPDPVESAVTHARQAILVTSRNEWATPVLYLRADDGVVFTSNRPEALERARVDALTEPLPQPAGLGGWAAAGRGYLTWLGVTADAGRVHYEVYRDGQLCAETSDTRYVEDHPPVAQGADAPIYSVIAVDDTGRRSPTSDEVRLPPPSPPPPNRRAIPRRALLGAAGALILAISTWTAISIAANTDRPDAAARPAANASAPPGTTAPDATTAPPTPTTTGAATRRTTPGPSSSSATLASSGSTTSLTTTSQTGDQQLKVPGPVASAVAAADLAISIDPWTYYARDLVVRTANHGGQQSAPQRVLITLTNPGAVFIRLPTTCKKPSASVANCDLAAVPPGSESQFAFFIQYVLNARGGFDITATLLIPDGNGNDTATRTIVCGPTTTCVPG